MLTVWVRCSRRPSVALGAMPVLQGGVGSGGLSIVRGSMGPPGWLRRRELVGRPVCGAGRGAARATMLSVWVRCSRRPSVAHGVGAMPVLQRGVGSGGVSIVQGSMGRPSWLGAATAPGTDAPAGGPTLVDGIRVAQYMLDPCMCSPLRTARRI